MYHKPGTVGRDQSVIADKTSANTMRTTPPPPPRQLSQQTLDRIRRVVAEHEKERGPK